MYGHPTDPTFNQVYVRELRSQGIGCGTCRFNVQKPGLQYCAHDHGAWPAGPCPRYEERAGDE